MASQHRSADGRDASRIDLATVLAEQGVDGARVLVTQIVMEEVSRVLRIPKDDLSLFRPLAEAGLDSLMAVELAITLQERLGLDGQPLGAATALSIAQVADEIVGGIGAAPAATTTAAIAQRHLTDAMDAEAVSALAARLEQKSRELKGVLQ
jgi:acyl carrier protein